MEKETLFLTASQAVDAVCIDFRQYEHQTLLFCEVIRLIADDRIHIKREPDQDGAWLSRQGDTKMKWVDGAELIEIMCRAVRETRWSPELLSAVCARVFQTRARPSAHPGTGAPGINIETNMSGFQCIQCGDCCRCLDYHDGVTAGDVAGWKEQGREDILKRVQAVDPGGSEPKYRIWVDPARGVIEDPCPFLCRGETPSQWRCDIHAAKPKICRQYPVSRKHALMTGCRGFQGSMPKSNTRRNGPVRSKA